MTCRCYALPGSTEAKYVTANTTIALASCQYESMFSLSDLRGIVAFLDSPLGATFLDVQRRAFQRVRPEIDSLLQPHQAELTQQMQILLLRGRRP